MQQYYNSSYIYRLIFNKFINSRNAKVHVLNHSLHFATSVFEGIRVYKGKPFLMGEHYLRLIKSCKLYTKYLVDILKKTMIFVSYTFLRMEYI